MLKYYQQMVLLNNKLTQGKDYTGEIYLLRDRIIIEDSFAMKNWMLKMIKERIIKYKKEPEKIIIKNDGKVARKITIRF